jgi:hypothetical protein
MVRQWPNRLQKGDVAENIHDNQPDWKERQSKRKAHVRSFQTEHEHNLDLLAVVRR